MISHALSLALLLGSAPALPCGGFYYEDQATDAVHTADLRVVFVADGSRTTAVYQVAIDGFQDRFAWLLPIPGPLVVDDDRVRVGKAAGELLDELISGTDPTWYRAYPGCRLASLGAYGCYGEGLSRDGDTASVGAEAMAELPVGPFEILYFDADSDTDVVSWLAQGGFDVPQEAESTIDRYLALGWRFLAVELLPEALYENAALPAVSFTYEGGQVALPLVMAAETHAESVEAVVFTLASQPMAPVDDPWLLPTEATSFEGADFSSWYRERAAALLDAQEGRAWLLEYQGAQEPVRQQRGEVTQTTLTGPAEGLSAALVESGMVSAGTFEGAVVLTRWRTWLQPDHWTDDLELGVDPAVPELELRLTTLSGATWPAAPAVLLWWTALWWRRRED